jgi:UDPglucose 6-dehydrogenase
MQKKTVGIWGSGVVGTATGKLFEMLAPDDVRVIYYDKFKETNATKEEVAKESDFIFVCLPTPMKVTGAISLDYLYSAFAELRAMHLSYGKEIIIRSTSVSGSSDYIASIYSEFNISFMPEFLTEKNAIHDMVHATRIVIGAHSDRSFALLKDLFQCAYEDSIEYIRMSRSEAETYKYLCNVMLAMSVLVANECYLICDAVGVDYNNIEPYLKFDTRLSTFTKVPGHDGDMGVGGKCFPKDLNAFIHLAESKGYVPQILKAGDALNNKVRIHHDWLSIPGAVEGNKKFGGKKNEA